MILVFWHLLGFALEMHLSHCHPGPGCPYLVPVSWEMAQRTLFPSCMINPMVTPPPGQLPSLGYAGDRVTQEGSVYLSSENSRAPGLFPTPPRPGTRGAGGEGPPDLVLLFQGRRQLPLPGQMKPFLSQVPQSLISGCVCG